MLPTAPRSRYLTAAPSLPLILARTWCPPGIRSFVPCLEKSLSARTHPANHLLLLGLGHASDDVVGGTRVLDEVIPHCVKSICIVLRHAVLRDLRASDVITGNT